MLDNYEYLSADEENRIMITKKKSKLKKKSPFAKVTTTKKSPFAIYVDHDLKTLDARGRLIAEKK